MSEIDFQIMWNRLIAIVEEQAQALRRTAFSPIVRESGDLSAARVFDASRAACSPRPSPATPGHVELDGRIWSSAISSRPSRGPITMREGDVYVQPTTPWKGTRPSATTDVVRTSPGLPSQDPARRRSSPAPATSTDIGGIGFGPDGDRCLHGGSLGVPFLKLFDRGVLNETLMAIVKENTRLPVECEGDLYSLANCNEIGARRLIEMLEEFGLDDIGGPLRPYPGEARTGGGAERRSPSLPTRQLAPYEMTHRRL